MKPPEVAEITQKGTDCIDKKKKKNPVLIRPTNRLKKTQKTIRRT